MRIEEYIYTPQIDPSQGNAYAMVIGMRPGAAMRAIGEVDYENARLIAGRPLREADTEAPVTVGHNFAMHVGLNVGDAKTRCA